MNLHLSPRAEAFRHQVRQFLHQALPAGFSGFEEESAESYDYWACSRAFARRLGERGWLALTWPQEYGGRAASAEEEFVLAEELGYHAAPFYNRTVSIVGPVIMAFGSPEQKAAYLPPIARGEIEFCVGLTEPDSGSDLASLSCQAVATGEGFVINGHKTFTSNAHHADYCLLLARTDPQAPKHKGLSLFIVDMNAPGVTVRPLINSVGWHCFNDIYFDNLALPAESLLGERGQGWYEIVFSLNHERTVHAAGIARAALYQRTLNDLIEYVKGARGGVVAGNLRHKLSALATDIEVFRLLSWRIAWLKSQGATPDWQAAMAKLLGSQLMGRLASAYLEAQGLHGQLGADPGWGLQGGRIQRMFLAALGVTIGGGTLEVLRNIIAQRGLGLPR